MKEPQDKRRSFAEIRALAKPVERTVTVCLAGDLNAQYEDLERNLGIALKSPQVTLGSIGAEREIADAMEALRAKMTEHEVTFRFRGMSSRGWSDLMAEHPGRPGKDEAFNTETFPDAMLAACAVDPVMNVEEVTELADTLSNSQFGALFECAWACNQKAFDVPFSVAASRVLSESEPN